MSEAFIPYARQSLDEDDIAAVVEVLRGDWLTQGPNIAAFEAAVAARVGARHGIAVATGTAALHCACYAAGVGPGDEVITAPITFAASGNCALYLGAEVKFADIRRDTYCLDPARLEAAITAKTKAIIPIDYTGQPADMDEINEIAARHGITVIEDSAHSLGATYKGRSVGSLAAMSIFSFHPVKAVAMGEGGLIATDDDDLAAALRLFRTHGITNDGAAMRLASQAADKDGGGHAKANASDRAPWYYEMQELGFNYRVTDIQCALGLSQLAKLDGFLARRREIAARYSAAFGQSELLIPPHQESDRESAWHLYMLRLRRDRLRKSRRRIFEQLRARKIGVHVHYIPLHLQPYYREKFGYKRGDFPESEAYYDAALTIPLFPAMTDSDCRRVIDAVLSCVG
ncbi:MAG: UDP-4-amino-4,6-dideoxy-N-acetyl-beta-L-altrosamine transaminase [Alphaproteobacteria bacterium]|jgi:UDP-4-amino-4,6-dideoxy-N-acetyl-beta-L-altrosamine transaminase|nr:UDP-4-amino-4,6-dideoxy-N-acetyl-beta-L-altrosamine transaminase [Alphaproteobacteria bacterium]MDP6589208.1 UDP-4-amino-4,6-dideoxy-N-acetyl-beta-L-altrosamine transaminase [Alphaproteobacteria bacterium]MDP6816683.1 UDP-4-amino-4,6-dideoxy-N-acetyl-beta-L-altrosamine transaminase [Alphaproteobacteria bacterium]